MNKDILIDAINGIGTGSMDSSIEYEKIGLAIFTGNQHNPDWRFKQSKLDSMSEPELEDLYKNLSSKRV